MSQQTPSKCERFIQEAAALTTNTSLNAIFPTIGANKLTAALTGVSSRELTVVTGFEAQVLAFGESAGVALEGWAALKARKSDGFLSKKFFASVLGCVSKLSATVGAEILALETFTGLKVDSHLVPGLFAVAYTCAFAKRALGSNKEKVQDLVKTAMEGAGPIGLLTGNSAVGAAACIAATPMTVERTVSQVCGFFNSSKANTTSNLSSETSPLITSSSVNYSQ
jgi:glucose uptake protein GlcU